MAAQERSHERLLKTITGASGDDSSTVARLEEAASRHRRECPAGSGARRERWAAVELVW
ncbi:MAG: hypothetical protein U0703_06910 [Anaerolineae bacterium]